MTDTEPDVVAARAALLAEAIRTHVWPPDSDVPTPRADAPSWDAQIWVTLDTLEDDEHGGVVWAGAAVAGAPTVDETYRVPAGVHVVLRADDAEKAEEDYEKCCFYAVPVAWADDSGHLWYRARPPWHLENPIPGRDIERLQPSDPTLKG